jgi:DNA-directed RNA polymerase specialized sigma24 family protein
MVTNIFIKVMDKLSSPTISVPESFDKWLYVVSKNEIINVLREKIGTN